jgi:5,10-methylenetetrahydromethanopterin reductase
MIAAGAVLGDRLTFNLGADRDRLAWGIGQARAARRAAGMDPDAISLGAYVDVACARTTAEALAMVRGSASIFAHFLSEGMAAHVPVDSAEDRRVLTALAAGYAEAAHGQTKAPQAQLLPDDFLERFTLSGPVAAVAARIGELESLGLDRIVVVPASRDVDPAAVEQSVADFAAGVIGEG